MGEVPGIEGLTSCGRFSGMGFKISRPSDSVMSENDCGPCRDHLDIAPRPLVLRKQY